MMQFASISVFFFLIQGTLARLESGDPTTKQLRDINTPRELLVQSINIFDATNPDPVLLSTAENYAILSKSGVTTTPGSAVCGNVGTSPIATTALTGFGLVPGPFEIQAFSTSPMVFGTLTGASHLAPTPATLGAAVLDMEAAYTDASTRAFPVVLHDTGAAYTITDGTVLTRGIYKWMGVVTTPAGAGVASTLTFDGENEPDSVWIMQIAGNLALGSYSKILLTNGAKAGNIFWAVHGDIAVGTYAHAEGIMLTYTMIALKTGSTLNGAAYAQTAVTLDATTLINDLTSPVINGVPTDETVLCSNIPDKPTDVTVTDNFDPNPVMSYSQVQSSGSSCASGYTLERTWMATDACNNTATGTQIITVHDAPSALPSVFPSAVPSASPTKPPTRSPTRPPIPVSPPTNLGCPNGDCRLFGQDFCCPCGLWC